MNTSLWLHIDTGTCTAQLIKAALAADAEASVAGHAYCEISNPIEFVSHALDMSYGDADSVLMAADMQGADDAWFPIKDADYDRIESYGDFQGMCRRIALGAVATGDDATWITLLDGTQVDLPPAI